MSLYKNHLISQINLEKSAMFNVKMVSNQMIWLPTNLRTRLFGLILAIFERKTDIKKDLKLKDALWTDVKESHFLENASAGKDETPERRREMRRIKPLIKCKKKLLKMIRTNLANESREKDVTKHSPKQRSSVERKKLIQLEKQDKIKIWKKQTPF